MNSVAKVLFAFVLTTLAAILLYGVSWCYMALVALCLHNPAIGLPIAVFIYTCSVWAVHHSMIKW